MTNLGNLVWNIADQLRGVYKPAQYGSVVLPMTVLRRMECVIAPHKEQILAQAGRMPNEQMLQLWVQQEFGLNIYNTAPYSLRTLLNEPAELRDNLIAYLHGFSPNVADIFERYGFEKQIAKLDEKDRLYLVVQQFSGVDLRPSQVTNTDMGSVFEDLIRRFAAASNETAGEHFTPRDAIRLMVDLLLAPDDDALAKPGVVRSVYDPTAGTGGMLSVVEEHVLEHNPEARIVMAGQELNDESYAICKSDMIAKNQDVDAIALGDTLADDLHAGRTFDYCLSNPPYGGDWKASQKKVVAEHKNLGSNGRFGAGLPRISDGQMLFLQHLVAKMQPAPDGGGRAGIVLNGSPLFTGGAGSGESEIRRWLLESDLVDAIVALPTNMFYNTGIATYVWILDNQKPQERRGKVQLIDATHRWTKLRKNLGSKNREIADADREAVVRLYAGFEEGPESKVLEPADFGYQEITVERPLKLRFELTEDTIAAAMATGPVAKLSDDVRQCLRDVVGSMSGRTWTDRDAFVADFKKAAKDARIALGASVLKAVWQTVGVHDDDAIPVTDPKGRPEPDTSLRDTELVPLREDVQEYFEREVLPFVPDAWIDESKTRIGYEIPFTRLFYVYEPPRPLEEIDAELEQLTREIITLLQEVEG
ncbi:N-6 DNA methylase [Kocuria sp. M1N1S27]|uniref:type I restriction-modification system subunit M n=1 Tax=Kocuria kalidii TaxID=3376283 RepID=UPI0037AD4579